MWVKLTGATLDIISKPLFPHILSTVALTLRLDAWAFKMKPIHYVFNWRLYHLINIAKNLLSVLVSRCFRYCLELVSVLQLFRLRPIQFDGTKSA